MSDRIGRVTHILCAIIANKSRVSMTAVGNSDMFGRPTGSALSIAPIDPMNTATARELVAAAFMYADMIDEFAIEEPADNV